MLLLLLLLLLLRRWHGLSSRQEGVSSSVTLTSDRHLLSYQRSPFNNY
jgi:hypothetical protein